MTSMEGSIFLFDMDHTLIDNDCDVSWKTFLVERGLAPAESLQTAEVFFRDYVANRLDIDQFMAFQLAEFRGRTWPEMETLAALHFQTCVKPRIYRDAVAFLETVHRHGFPMALLTASNLVIARPLADHLGIDTVLAVRPELAEGRFTGRFVPPYSGGPGKVQLGAAFCRDHDTTLQQAAYFGDSLADVPMLTAVGFPNVVNPGTELRQLAAGKGWPIRIWR